MAARRSGAARSGGDRSGACGTGCLSTQVIPAAKAGRVYAIPGKHMTTTSHHIVRAVEDVQAIVGR
jgi:hypothetical protein